jgi:hypothetical protein
LACALALVAAALGCRSNTNQFLLQQESRMFEDEVYALEAELDATCQEKTALQRENEPPAPPVTAAIPSTAKISLIRLLNVHSPN